jgi:hypothetical protein
MAGDGAIDPRIREGARLVIWEPHDRNYRGEWPTWPHHARRITITVGRLSEAVFIEPGFMKFYDETARSRSGPGRERYTDPSRVVIVDVLEDGCDPG